MDSVLPVHTEQIVDMWKSVDRKPPFQTLVIWPGTTVSCGDAIEEFFLKEYETRIKRVGCVPVTTDRDFDFAFFVHDDDIMKFALKRMKYARTPDMFCRWWEDIYFNNQEHEYPAEFCRMYPNA